MSEQVDATWRWEDAWVLQAICMAVGGDDRAADLRGVMGAADAVNHAVLTFGELDGALRKLAGAGLVAVDGDVVTLTAEGQSLCRLRAEAGLHEGARQLELLLGRLPVPAPGGQVLSSSVYTRTLDTYLGR